MFYKTRYIAYVKGLGFPLYNMLYYIKMVIKPKT